MQTAVNRVTTAAVNLHRGCIAPPSEVAITKVGRDQQRANPTTADMNRGVDVDTLVFIVTRGADNTKENPSALALGPVFGGPMQAKVLQVRTSPILHTPLAS